MRADLDRMEAASTTPAGGALARALLAAEALSTRTMLAPDTDRPDPPAAVAAIDAVERAVRAPRLDVDTIVTLHDATAGADGAELGLRRRRGFLHRVRDGKRVGVVFEGAPAPELAGRLTEVGRWADDPCNEPVVQAVGTYMEIGSLHPFIDGNGRTARLLVQVVLRRRGVLVDAVAPFGAVVARNQRQLVKISEAWRSGDTAEALGPLVRTLHVGAKRAIELYADHSFPGSELER